MTRRFAADGFILNRASLLFASMLLVGLGAASTFAQKPADVVGNWSGALQVDGGLLRLALHVSTDTAGKLSVTLDSLDQNAMGLQGSNAVLKGDSFSFEIPSVSGTYTGTLDGDGKNIRGTWSQGVPLPLVFTRQNGGPVPTAMPTPTPAPAMPPVALDNLKPVVDRELAPVLDHGLLSKVSGGGLVIGLMDRGQRRIFAYGTAKQDPIFEIGSITKTFTGLLLAQMVVQKKEALDTPIRTLLPAGVVAKPKGTEITLVDLATQHSGLPRMPDNLKPQNPFKIHTSTTTRRNCKSSLPSTVPPSRPTLHSSTAISVSDCLVTGFHCVPVFRTHNWSRPKSPAHCTSATPASRSRRSSRG